MITFDIVIPTYNNLSELLQCLEGFKEQTFQDFRILVCVDGSTDKTESVLKKTDFPFSMKILKHPKNVHLGRNATRNLILPHLTARFLVTIDSDMVPASDFLQQHYRLLSQSACISQGKVVYLNKRSNSWADYIQSRGKNKYSHGETLPYYYLTTGNSAMPVHVFKEIGGQDAAMTKYGGGDTELAYRLYQAFRLPVIYNARAVSNSHNS
jgi:glycosyltransferase involved in cell wall biosynthesis